MVELVKHERFTGKTFARTDAEVLDAIDTEVCGLLAAKETVDSLPTGWEEWKDIMASEASCGARTSRKPSTARLGHDHGLGPMQV